MKELGTGRIRIRRRYEKYRATSVCPKKGCDSKFDFYSGFFDDGGASTGLEKILNSHHLNPLLIYGLAMDYCVKATAMDALASGFKVIVIEDLCRGVAQDTTNAGLEERANAGIQNLLLAKILYGLVFPTLDIGVFHTGCESHGFAELFDFFVQVTGHEHGLITSPSPCKVGGKLKVGPAISASPILAVGGNVFDNGIGPAAPC